MVKVAAYQVAPAKAHLSRKVQAQAIIAKASSDHIDFLCLPEGFLTGYYEDEKQARVNSLEVRSQAFEEWLTIFNKASATIIVGFNEREGDQLL
jgi:predicted amidohydrolase